MQTQDKTTDSSAAVTFVQARRLADAWIEAWNSHDLDRIMSHYADNVQFTANTVVTRWGRPGGRLKGKVELRRHFAKGLQLAPNLHFTVREVFATPGGYAVLYSRENGNTAIDSVRLDQDGLAVEVTAYYAIPQL